jgi:hypothetical protein
VRGECYALWNRLSGFESLPPSSHFSYQFSRFEKRLVFIKFKKWTPSVFSSALPEYCLSPNADFFPIARADSELLQHGLRLTAERDVFSVLILVHNYRLNAVGLF